MTNEIEPTSDRIESFGTLLEQSFENPSLQQLLAEKVDQDLFDGADQTEGSAGKKAHTLFTKGLQEKSSGLLEESYITFGTILTGGEMSERHRYYTIKNLADVSVQLFDAKESVEERLSWVEKAYFWFARLREATIDEEPPKNKFHTITQLGRLKYRHHLIVDDIEQKRQLLKEAYEEIDSARDIIPQEQSSWQLIFNSSLHVISRKFCLFAENEGERKLWLQRWYEAAEAAAGIPELSKQPDIKTPYLISMAYALADLADTESDVNLKLGKLHQSYALMIKALEFEGDSENSLYAQNRLGVTAKIALKIAGLEKDQEEKNQWIVNSYRLNRKAFELAIEGSDSRRYLQFSIRAIDSLLQQVSLPEEREALLREKLQVELLAGQTDQKAATQTEDGNLKVALFQYALSAFATAANIARELSSSEGASDPENLKACSYDYMLESGKAALQIGDLKHVAHSYSLAADVAEDIAKTKVDMQERALWLERCYEGRIKSAEFAVKSDNLRHAAVALGLAGKVAQQVETCSFPDKKHKWKISAYKANYKAGELWQQVNRPDLAKRSFGIALAIAKKYSLKEGEVG